MPPRKRREPQQTAFIKSPPPQLKNGDILDVDEAAALLRVSKKTVYKAQNERSCHQRQSSWSSFFFNLFYGLSA
jgi:hypothetical protein